MNNLYRWASKTPNYIRRFGILHGIRLLFGIERQLSMKSKQVRQYSLPGYPAPINLRETTSDHSIFWQCIVQCQYDIDHFPQANRLKAAYTEAVAQGKRPLIIDCGGNIGLAAVWFAMHFPEAVICTVEPDSQNFEIIEMNTACFGDRVKRLKGGVWHEKGWLRITNPQAGSAAYQVAHSANPTDDSIRAYTIDEICHLMGAEHALIIKIDIEGAQENLFKSNTDWVGKTHLLTLELDDWLIPWGGTSRNFFKCISQYPFDYLLGGESVFCFRDFEA